MSKRCVVCEFPSDAVVTLPTQWERYLIEECGFERRENGELSVPVCLGCRREMNRYLDPREPAGGTEPDATVREFLDRFETPITPE